MTTRPAAEFLPPGADIVLHLGPWQWHTNSLTIQRTRTRRGETWHLTAPHPQPLTPTTPNPPRG